jgi:hypothetical protein
MYGQELKSDCPGTSKCQVFKKSKRCKACPRGTDAPEVIDPIYENDAIDHIHTLAIERECGRVVNPDDLHPLEWRLLLGWHAVDRAYQRAYLGQLADVAAVARSFVSTK